jgi:hypothetical protein
MTSLSHRPSPDIAHLPEFRHCARKARRLHSGLPVLKGGLALSVLLLTGCPGDPLSCSTVDDPDASAPGLVDDALVGAHTGTLTWLETTKQTQVLVTVVATGPVSHLVEVPGSDPCPAGHRIALDVSVQPSDGLIPPTRVVDTGVEVDSDGHLELDGLDLGVDAGPILAGGAAPEEPDLASLSPQATLALARGDGGAPSTGALRVTGPSTSVTLATLAF